MASFIKLRDFLANATITKSTDPLVYKTLFSNLYLVLNDIKIIPEPELIATSNLAILEDVVNGKNFLSISKTLQAVIVSIYDAILKSAPGYVVRNVLSNLLTICTNKSSLGTSKECAAVIIGKIMETRSLDCGSMITDMIQNLTKLIKNGDVTQRIAGLNAIQSIVLGAGSKIGDCHNDIVKLVGKYISDKSVEVKMLIASVIEAVSINSNGCTTVSAEVLLAPAAKGLEDDIAIVQDAFANTFATIFYQQIRTHAEGLQQAKIGLARGELNEAGKVNASPKKTTISKLKELSAAVTSTKRGVDEQDFRSIIQHFLKNIYKSNGTLRAGYICSLSYLIKLCLQSISHNELEWLVLNCIAMFKDPATVSLSYEDMAYFRARISHLLRTSILMNLHEIQQLKYANFLVQFVSSDAENRNDSELQLALGELSHVVTILGQAAVSISDDINGAATIYLRHAAFGVRTAAAYVLASLSTVAPAIAAGFLRNSLITAQTQTKQLSVLDPDESSKNKSIKDAERLQRMYFFHGHTLVIAIFLKNENSFPTGLPKDLIFDIFNFGLSLLENDVLAAPASIRHVVCSIVRAGSLIVSSCLNMGQTISYEQIFALLKQCQNILNVTLVASSTGSVPPNQNDSNNNNGSGDDLLYEIMCLEAALVCISTLLWSTPEALINDNACLALVISCLDTAFQAVKNKYQSKYRTHFRFRTLHTILLECFAWLPPGSFPDSSQAVFVESLRVFRDCINAGYECTCLGDFASDEFKMFGSFSGQPLGKATVLQPETPTCESLLILKLENYAVALQKKESEAFLASFSTDNQNAVSDSSRLSLQAAVEWSKPTAPVAQIDSRTINASIALLAATFGHQDNECQEKAVQLCSQAMSQITKSNNSSSISMFSSEEEKRKRDKKNFVTIKNVVTALCAIIKSFSLPLSMSMNSSLSWGQVLADRLFEVLIYPSVEIRCAAAISLGTFAGKVIHTSLLETASGLINDAVTTAIEKKENLSELSGYLIALSSLSTITIPSKANTKRSIIMTLFECLRKVDSPSLFRAHGLLAVALVVKGIAQVNEDEDSSETYALLERTCHLIELQLVSISGSDDIELLCAAIQRTVNVTINAVCHSLAVIRASNIKEKELLLDIRNRLHRVWEVVRKTSSAESVTLETIEYIARSFHPSFGPLKDEEITVLLKQEISNKKWRNNKILLSVMEGIRLLSKKNPSILLKEEIDISLIELLDWCIAATEASTNSAYAGLELRLNSSTDNIVGDITLLQKLVENTILHLASVDIDDNCMDQRVGRWLLLCRAVALGVRTGGSEEKGEESEGGREGEDDGGGEFGADDVHVDVAASKNADGDILVNNGPWTYVQYVSWCRDQASKRCHNLTAARVKIRAIAMKYGTTLLTKLNHTTLHKDIKLARETIQKSLQQFGPSPSDEDLSTLPCYLSLLIHDIVTMSCACMTYTIEDKHMIQLQTESVLLMRKVMFLFCESIDPDVVGSSEDKPGNNRILMQYMSQLVSAIRQCLTVSWCPVLQLSTYLIVCDWIQEGFLADKVIIRRLLKVICERFDTVGAITARAPTSADVSESITTIDHVIGCTVVSRLFTLTKKGLNSRLDSQVQSTVSSMIEGTVPKLHSTWLAIFTDAARILQNRDDASKDEPLTIWTTGTQEVDSRRGGLTYCSNAEPGKMKCYFEWALPNVVAALSLSPSITPEELVSLFAISMATLEHYYSLRKCSTKTNNAIESSNDGDLLIIVALASLAKIDTNRVIPTAQWAKVFCFINEYLLPSSQLIFSNGNQLTDLIIQTLTLVNNSMDRFSEATVSSELSSWIFITSLNVVKLIFPSVFAESSSGYANVKFGNILRSNYKTNDLSLFEMILEVDRNTNGKMHVLSSLFSVIVQFASEMNTLYIIQLFTAIIPLAAIASINENTSRKEMLRNIILENISKLIKEKRIEEEQLFSILGEDLLTWQEIFVVENSSEVIQNAVIESILDAWHYLSSSSNNITPLEFIPPQICILIHQSNKGTSYCRLALVCLLRIMQSNTEKSGPCIMNAILPSLLTILDSTMDESYELVVVQIIFFAFNLVEENRMDLLVGQILLPLINVMSKRSSDSMTYQFLGKCLTHLARTYQETFRLQVSLLNDVQRQVLQEAMRNVLQQQQQQQQLQEQNQQHGPSSVASIKKIDLTKFKK